jgi:hypothetical protein
MGLWFLFCVFWFWVENARQYQWSQFGASLPCRGAAARNRTPIPETEENQA